MSKILKIGIACALTCALTNVTLAATFDPLTDAATNSDALLGLDLPTDFGDLDPLTIPATTDPTTPPTTTVPATTTPTTVPTTTPTTTTTPTPTAIPTMAGSGGALDGTNEPQTSAKTVSVSQKKTTNQSLMTPMPSSFSNGEMMSRVSGNMVSGRMISGGMTSESTVHNYGMHGSAPKSKLAETGPTETLTLAFGAAISLTILIRRNIKHA